MQGDMTVRAFQPQVGIKPRDLNGLREEVNCRGAVGAGEGPVSPLNELHRLQRFLFLVLPSQCVSNTTSVKTEYMAYSRQSIWVIRTLPELSLKVFQSLLVASVFLEQFPPLNEGLFAKHIFNQHII